MESPILALSLLPVAIVALVAAGRWLAAGPRWVLRATVLLLLAAVAGPGVQCERPLKIAVLVDVSPSTRGATFRDPLSLKTRLTPLLAGRPYTIHYFADGLQPTPTEPAAQRTRLEAPADADAIVLLSDGRFDRPANLPAVFPVMDPALDAPVDARVRDVRPTERGVAVDVVSAGPARPLMINDSPTQPIATGPATVALGSTLSGKAFDRIGFAPGDRWPENDVILVPRVGQSTQRWAVDLTLPGMDRVTAADLRPGVSSFLDISCLVLPTDRSASVSLPAVLGYVQSMGGTLVLVGSPAQMPGALRIYSPLSAVPPAGPQAWVVLLDASGSMAAADGDATRWARALAATDAALDRLANDARVTVLRFAGEVRPIIENVAPAAARQALAAAEPPSGRTGLRAALESVARRANRSAVRVLLLTDGDADLSDTASLSDELRQANVTVSAVVGTPSADLSAICTATGGSALQNVAPAEWARSFGGLVRASADSITAAERLDGAGLLAGRVVASSQRWPVYSKQGADLLLTSHGEPAAAVWNVGAGRVVAVAATLSAADLATVARQLERPPADPRFVVTFDILSGHVELKATDVAGPMNALSPTLRRPGKVTAFTQIAPGRYAASLERLADPSMATVAVGEIDVARQALAGRSPPEFDTIGNDRAALAELVERTGGQVIESGDVGAIAFPSRFQQRSLRAPLAAMAVLTGLAGSLWLRREGKTPAAPF